MKTNHEILAEIREETDADEFLAMYCLTCSLLLYLASNPNRIDEIVATEQSLDHATAFKPHHKVVIFDGKYAN